MLQLNLIFNQRWNRGGEGVRVGWAILVVDLGSGFVKGFLNDDDNESPVTGLRRDEYILVIFQLHPIEFCKSKSNTNR